MFLLKAITIVFSLIFIIGFAAHSKQSSKAGHKGVIQFNNLSDDFEDDLDELKQRVLSKDEYKAYKKEKKKSSKEESKKAKSSDVAKEDDDSSKQNIYVVEFEGDMKASAVSNLREEISAILMIANQGDQVVVKLNSPGGMVHTYGLASSQLKRVRDNGLDLVACVDEVAASGGYMMACVANKICAAPFAIIGSIGVIGQIPNFNKVLKKNQIEFEQHTAGEYKRTLTMFGENTDEARDKFKQELQETHDLFKGFIHQNRVDLDVEKVATGEHWYGQQALELGLVDELTTSDDYILNQLMSDSCRVFAVKYEIKKPLAERLSENFVKVMVNVSQQLNHKVSVQKLFKM